MLLKKLAVLAILGVGSVLGAEDKQEIEELFILNQEVNKNVYESCKDSDSLKKIIPELEKYSIYLNDPNRAKEILKMEKFKNELKLFQAKSSLNLLEDCNDIDLEQTIAIASNLKNLCPELTGERTSVHYWSDPNLINNFKKTCRFTEERGKSPLFISIPNCGKIGEYIGKEPPPIEFSYSFNLGWDLKSTFAKKLNFESYRGNVILVNFFTEWCGPCKQERPYLEKIFEKYNGKVKVIGVCCEATKNFWGNYPKLEKIIRDEKITYPIIIMPKKNKESPYEINAWPQSFLIGKDGKIIKGRSSIEEELLK
jgi:thiol-disulfide isomerase/thioredoxin